MINVVEMAYQMTNIRMAMGSYKSVSMTMMKGLHRD